MVTGVVSSSPRLLPSSLIAHRVQQSHCSSIFHRVLQTRALTLSARQFVHKKKSPRIYTSMHSAGFEVTKLTYTTLENNLIRHRGDGHASMPTKAVGNPPFKHSAISLLLVPLQDVHFELMHSSHNRQICPLKGVNSFRTKIELSRPLPRSLLFKRPT